MIVEKLSVLVCWIFERWRGK